jgi:Tfp pilus assembly protein PilF
MFMNNRAAESLLRGELAPAYAYAREAVRQDTSFPGGFNTLGVIYQQRGLPNLAERAFRQALVLDDNDRAALDNLAQLYESQGRAGAAAPLRQALLRIEREPPFHQFDLGREALARGAYTEAREHFERALARDPDYHEFHYWLAVALAGQGDARGASRHLKEAMDNSTTRRDLDLYAGKLDRLKALAREH